MDTILFLILRRMRTPLLALSTVYATATLGLVFIPGVDDQGNVWHMSFFEAFYFVSFMGTTIGFGELPYPFSDAQRLWVLVFIYVTVIAWIYAIGTLIALVQNAALRQAFTERGFARAVRKLREPFYLVCGYGDTGSALVESLEQHGIRSVVVEIKQERINVLTLSNYPIYVPKLCADAGHPWNLLQAGVRNPRCAGVVALTNENKVNLHIAITARVLNPKLKVICRAESHEVEANMASFGTHHIIDPFDTFADRLATALYAPCQYLLTNWLGADPDKALGEPLYLPRGLWILCGYGRFGQAVYRQLTAQGIPVHVIEPDPVGNEPPEGTVIGLGTEAVTLQQACVKRAVGIVAGTSDDSNNLSIIMTARELKPDLFVVVRQNLNRNKEIFDSAGADVVMQPSRVVADRIRGLLSAPLLEDFLELMLRHDDEWACVLVSRIAGICTEKVPAVWEITVNQDDAYAVHTALAGGQAVRLGHLLRDPRDRTQKIPCIALLLGRGEERHALPSEEEILRSGDRLVFAGVTWSHSRMGWTLQNQVALTYVTTGRALPQSYVWRWIAKAFARSTAKAH